MVWKKKKIIKKVPVLKFNLINASIVVICVFIGFSIVFFNDSIYNRRMSRTRGEGDLLRAANRIADAFELYNQKRFDR